MKTYLAIILGAMIALPAAAQQAPPYTGSKEFEKIKSLVGSWTGKMKMDPSAPEMEITVEYRLVAGGSAIEERTFADTPKEMVTMYHDKDGKLALTHYCMLHNQPGMVLKSSDDKSINFDFDPSCSVDVEKEMHMHSLIIHFVDEETIRQEWTLFIDGKAQGKQPITLKRAEK
jgi:hypothetical protein